MSRWKAASIHLAISALIATGAVALFVMAWFPPPHLGAAGGLRLLRTIVAVDVVLGPLLTLVVYKAGKKGLAFDLTVIAMLQTVALGYGLYMAHAQRPVYIVMTPDRATLVRAAEIYEDPTPRPAQYRNPPAHGIEQVTLRIPSEDERGRLVGGLMDGEPDMDYRPAYYAPLSSRLKAIVGAAERFSSRLKAQNARTACYRQWLADRDLEPEQLRILPLLGSKADLDAVFDARDGRVVGYLASSSASAPTCEP